MERFAVLSPIEVVLLRWLGGKGGIEKSMPR